jgi:hypothetical protein
MLIICDVLRKEVLKKYQKTLKKKDNGLVEE